MAHKKMLGGAHFLGFTGINLFHIRNMPECLVFNIITVTPLCKYILLQSTKELPK